MQGRWSTPASNCALQMIHINGPDFRSHIKSITSRSLSSLPSPSGCRYWPLYTWHPAVAKSDSWSAQRRLIMTTKSISLNRKGALQSLVGPSGISHLLTHHHCKRGGHCRRQLCGLQPIFLVNCHRGLWFPSCNSWKCLKSILQSNVKTYLEQSIIMWTS